MAWTQQRRPARWHRSTVSSSSSCWMRMRPLVVRNVEIGIVEERVPAGDAAVDAHLHAPDPQPLVAEPGLEARLQHAVGAYVGLDDAQQQARPHVQAALGLELLIGAHRGRILHDVVNRGDAPFETLLHRVGDAQLALGGVEVRNHTRHDVLCAFVQDAGGLAGGGGPLDGAPGRIRCVPVDSRQPQTLAVRHRHVGAEGDRDRVLWNRGVEILAVWKAFVLHAKVLHRAPLSHHPVARGGLRGLLGQAQQNGVDGGYRSVEVPAVHQLPLRQPLVRQVDVGIGQSRDHRAALEVHVPGIGAAQAQHLLRGADRNDPAGGAGHRLSDGSAGRERADLAIEEYRVGIRQMTSGH